jgi:dihydroorotase
MTVVPGLIDLHAHFREPGDEEAETVESGCRAAARGGFTSVVTMPNTRPPIDSRERILHLRGLAEAAGMIRVMPAGCLTANREGRALADMAAMAAAGAVAFTDDGTTPADPILMEQAMRMARRLRRPVLDHALDPDRAVGWAMHEGAASQRLALPGNPSEAEFTIVERDVALTEKTGCPVHIQHVSSALSVALIRRARRRGLPVSAEVTPHHLALSDEDVRNENANFKMSPPLRGREDRDALQEAVTGGMIQAFATDHAPHRAAEKAKGFGTAPFGVVGLETAIGVTYTVLVLTGRMSLRDWVCRWTIGPADVLGISRPSLGPGAPADVTVLDLTSPWTVRSGDFASRSRNTCFEGWRLTGRAMMTFLGGAMLRGA